MGPVIHPDERGPLRALDHVVVGVPDLPAAGRRWSAFLGLAPLRETEAAISFRFERSGIDFVPGRAASEHGLRGLVFGCDDVPRARETLERRGLVFEGDRVCAGPRGNFISLCEAKATDAAPTTEPSAVKYLDHVVVRTSDPDAAKELYGAQLGLRLPLDRSFPAWNARMLFFRTAGVTVEVTAALDGTDRRAVDGLYGLAFRVGSVEDAHRRIEKAGFSAQPPRRGRKEGTSVFELADPPSGVPTLVLGRALANTGSPRNV